MTSPSPDSGAPMTLIESGNISTSVRGRWTRKRPSSSHSNVTAPATVPSNCGWVASVAQVPIRRSNGSSAGSRSVMSLGPWHLRRLIGSGRIADGCGVPLALPLPAMDQQRDPFNSLSGCERILILGRTGSGETTLAREPAAACGVPHVELDSLYFGPEFSTAPPDVLSDRPTAAIAGQRWATDRTKRPAPARA